MIVGNNTTSTVSCIAITNGPQQPTVTISTNPFSASEFLRKGSTTVAKTSHGVHYTMSYGWGANSVRIFNKPVYFWGIAADFSGSPVFFSAQGVGAPGSPGFKDAMTIHTSVRRSP